LSTKNVCLTCDKRSFCKVPDDLKPLCQNLERYLTQTVDVPQRELQLTKPQNNLPPSPWPLTPPNTELIISMYFTERRGIREIARILEIDKGHISRTVKKYKQIIAENIKK